MSKHELNRWPQPEPITPGLTKEMVNEHAKSLVEERLLDHQQFNTEEWRMIEFDLIAIIELSPRFERPASRGATMSNS